MQAVRGDMVSPFHAAYGFRDVASIWFERNALMKTVYWPRNSHLEVVRFQDTAEHPDEMRVGRNEQRPDLVVRAVEWVVPDKRGVTGWRGLLMTDVHHFVPEELATNLGIPDHWAGWTVDLDDLPSEVPTGTVPLTLQGKTIAELDEEMKGTTLKDAKTAQIVADLGNWKTWTFDKLLLQTSKPDVEDRLRKEHPAALAAVAELRKHLEVVAADPAMGRRLRHLQTPHDVQITFRAARRRSRGPRSTRSRIASSRSAWPS